MPASACLLAGTLALSVNGGFSLSWTHSVERVEWRESWTVGLGALHLDEARIRGSGAGMEPGDGAVRIDGWWVWRPGLTVPDITLAASGATGAGWRLCTDSGCRIIGAESGVPIRLRPCPKGFTGG